MVSYNPIAGKPVDSDLFHALHSLDKQLWDVENHIRTQECYAEFGGNVDLSGIETSLTKVLDLFAEIKAAVKA